MKAIRPELGDDGYQNWQDENYGYKEEIGNQPPQSRNAMQPNPQDDKRVVNINGSQVTFSRAVTNERQIDIFKDHTPDLVYNEPPVMNRHDKMEMSNTNAFTHESRVTHGQSSYTKIKNTPYQQESRHPPESDMFSKHGSESVNSPVRQQVTYQSLTFKPSDLQLSFHNRNQIREFGNSFNNQFGFNFTRRGQNHNSYGSNNQNPNSSVTRLKNVKPKALRQIINPKNLQTNYASTMYQSSQDLRQKSFNPYQMPVPRNQSSIISNSEGLNQKQLQHKLSHGLITQDILNDLNSIKKASHPSQSLTVISRLQQSHSILNMQKTGTGLVQNDPGSKFTSINMSMHKNAGGTLNHKSIKKRLMAHSVSTTLKDKHHVSDSQQFDKHAFESILNDNEMNSTGIHTKDQSNQIFGSNDQFTSKLNDLSTGLVDFKSFQQAAETSEPFILKMDENFNLNLPKDQQFRELGKDQILVKQKKQQKSFEKMQFDKISKIQRQLASSSQFHSIRDTSVKIASQQSQQKEKLTRMEDDPMDSLHSQDEEYNSHRDNFEEISLQEPTTTQAQTILRGADQSQYQPQPKQEIGTSRSHSVLPTRRMKSMVEDQTTSALRQIYKQQMYLNESRRIKANMTQQIYENINRRTMRSGNNMMENLSQDGKMPSIQKGKPSLSSNFSYNMPVPNLGKYLNKKKKTTKLKLVSNYGLSESTNQTLKAKITDTLKQLLDPSVDNAVSHDVLMHTFTQSLSMSPEKSNIMNVTNNSSQGTLRLRDIYRNQRRSVCKIWQKYEDQHNESVISKKVKFIKENEKLLTNKQEHLNQYKDSLQHRNQTIQQKIEQEFDSVLEHKQLTGQCQKELEFKQPFDRLTYKRDQDLQPLQEIEFEGSLEVFNKDAKQALIESNQIVPLAKMDFDLRKQMKKYGYSNKDKLAMSNKLVSLEKGLDEQHNNRSPAVQLFIDQLNDKKQILNGMLKTQADRDDFFSLANQAIYQLQMGAQKRIDLNEIIQEIVQKQKDRELQKVQQFKDWQKQMWIKFNKNLKVKMAASRPQFINMYSEAANKHIKPFKENLRTKTFVEQEIKESFWRQPQETQNFREAIKQAFGEKTQGNQRRKKGESQEHFYRDLIIVKDENDRQADFYEDVELQKFVDKHKSTFEKIHDGDVEIKPQPESKKERQFVDELMNIRSRSKFLQKGLKGIFGSNQQFNSQDEAANHKFSIECHKNKALPMSNMIIVPEMKEENKYVLIDVNLTEEQAMSLGNSYSEFSSNIWQIYLINNHISGKAIGNFFRKLTPFQKKSLKSVIYGGKNELTEEVLDFINKELTSSLTELRLLGAHLNAPQLMPKFLTSLHYNMNLQTLALAKLQLDYQCAELISAILQSYPPELKELDLSWNKFTPKGGSLILRSLSGNNKLEQFQFRHNLVEKDDKVEAFGNFLRANFNLRHINLMGVFKTRAQVKRVIKKTKKSQSLLVVDLSQTPVIVQDKILRKYIMLKLKAELPDEAASPSKQKANSKWTYMSRYGAIQSIPFVQPNEIGDKYDWKNKFQMVLKAKAQQRLKIYYENQKIEQTNDYNDKINKKFILYRVMAHPELLGYNMKWNLSQQCYICLRDKYTLFVANQPGLELEGSVELLFSKTSQEPIRFVDIREFVSRIIERGQPEDEMVKDYIGVLPELEQDIVLSDPDRVSDLKQRLKSHDLTLYQDFNAWLSIINKKLAVKDIQLLHMFDDFFTLESHAASIEYGADPKLYVFADYMRFYKRIERIKFVRNIGDQSLALKQESFIGELRKEKFPTMSLDKVVKDKKITPFIQAKSIFKGWQKDTQQSLKVSLKYDLEFWKGHKVLKNKKDLQECEELIHKRYAQLKDIFTNLMSGDSYPFVGWIDFCTFCRVSEIQDSTVMTGPMIDNIFFATKFNPQPGGENKQLFRHEFLEILVRLSLAKYFQTGLAKTPVEALNMIIDLILEKYKLEEWQQFRDDQLWTNYTDKLLKQNMPQLQQLYDRLFPKYTGTQFRQSLQNVIDLMIKTPGIYMSEKEVRFCFGMSKMTVANEVGKFSDYFMPKLVEFYEFLGRAASIKFEDPEMLFHLKLEKLLKILFNDQGLRYIEVGDEIVNDLTSDESVEMNDEEVMRMDSGTLDIFGDRKLLD